MGDCPNQVLMELFPELTDHSSYSAITQKDFFEKLKHQIIKEI